MCAPMICVFVCNIWIYVGHNARSLIRMHCAFVLWLGQSSPHSLQTHTQYFNNEALSVSHTALCHCLQISMHTYTPTLTVMLSLPLCAFGCLVHQAKVLSPCSVWDVVFSAGSFGAFVSEPNAFFSFAHYIMLRSTPKQSVRDHLNEVVFSWLKRNAGADVSCR